MEVPKSLQGAWQKAAQDNVITKAEYKDIVKAAAPNGSDSDLDQEKINFLSTLNSELKKNGIMEKGSVPVGVLSFGQETKSTEEAPVKQTVATDTTEVETDAQEQTPIQAKSSAPTSIANNALFDGKPPISFILKEPEYPQASIQEWKGYTKETNAALINAFGLKQPVIEGKLPMLNSSKAAPILNAFGAGGIQQFQQMVGAKQDNKFGPETYFRTKNTVASQINNTQTLEDLTKLGSVLDLLGNDKQVDEMKSVVSQRMKLTQDFLSTKDSVQNYFNNINSIIGHANPKDMDSLVGAKKQLQGEFDKLTPNVKAMDQVSQANSEANSRIDDAIKSLQGELDSQNILKQKQQVVSDINGILESSVMSALKTGDSNKVSEGKQQVEAAVNKYPQVKDSDDIKSVKQHALNTLDSIGTKITSINDLMAKKDWSNIDNQAATNFLKELPDGDLKNKLAKSIEDHSEAAKLREKNKGNLKTTEEGLHDVIGNGFWNLENKDGTKAMFQLISKQGLLNDAMTKMNVDDQTRAINVLTKDVNFEKPSDADNFNINIAKSIYQNLSKSADVDKDIKEKLLPHLKKDEPSANFDKFNVDQSTYVNGMKFSIGADRIGSEKEAALTMARGIMNGEISNQLLGKFSRYELNDLTKYIEKKGSQEEKSQFLGTVASAYNSGVAVNIDSLDKKDKAKVIKGVLDSPSSDAKVTDLLKKSGKSTVVETVQSQNLSDTQLSVIGKNVNGEDMSDKPEVGSKILLGMIRTYNKQEANSSVKIEDIRKFIDQVSKNSWNDNNNKTMNMVISSLGDGPNSEYSKFQQLAPATLDKIRDVARSRNNSYDN